MRKILSLLIVIVSVQSFAFPLASSRLEFLPLSLTTGFNFEGIVELSNCSASVVRLEGALDSDKAWVLTNGHCLGGLTFLKPGEVKRNSNVTRSIKVYNADASDQVSLVAKKLVYATMTRTDMAIYELGETFSELLQDHGINALTLSSKEPAVGTAIEIISGYWERGYSCQIEAVIPKLEEDKWTFEESLRYSRPGCEIIGGTSGSPVIKAGTREVIAVNNTSNEDGKKCTLNNPCEVDANGNKTAIQGYSYAQQTAWIYTCLDSKGQLDLNISGCKLPK